MVTAAAELKHAPKAASKGEKGDKPRAAAEKKERLPKREKLGDRNDPMLRLRLGEAVECRQMEEGFEGSWFVGTIIGFTDDGALRVRYPKTKLEVLTHKPRPGP
eukprot:2419475-Prymnesium_polylepis.1